MVGGPLSRLLRTWRVIACRVNPSFEGPGLCHEYALMGFILGFSLHPMHCPQQRKFVFDNELRQRAFLRYYAECSSRTARWGRRGTFQHFAFFFVPLSTRFTIVIVVSQLGAGERSPLHDRGRSRQVGGSRVEFCLRIVARNVEIIRNVCFCDAAGRLVCEVKRLSECDLGSSLHN